jgi:hypothetical protein
MSYSSRSPLPRAWWRAGGALVAGYRAAGTLSLGVVNAPRY